MDSGIRTKNQRIYPQRYKTIKELPRGAVHRADQEPEVERAEPVKERSKIQPVYVEVPKDSDSMRRFKTAFMVITMVTVLGILGTLAYSTFAGPAEVAPKESAPTVFVPPDEIQVTATLIGSHRYNQEVKLVVAGPASYVLMVDPTTGISATVPLINGECVYESIKGGPDMNVVVFDSHDKPHSWKLSELLGGQG